MTSTYKRLDDGSVELSIIIPWAIVEKTYNQVIEKAVHEAQLPGFRKGKAPRKMVLEKLDKSKTYEDVLKILLPTVYNDAVSVHKLRPIVSPKIEFKEAKEGKDWLITVFTAEKPTLILGNYKKTIQDLNSSKRNKIWTPGSGTKKEDEKPQKPTLDEVLNSLYQTISIKIPTLLLDHEVNRLLSDLIDQTKKLGLTVEQYLASTNRSSAVLRKEYEEQARRTLALEFALEEIADKEAIIVSDDDIDTVIKTAKSDEERKNLQAQRYYVAGILRRQKTLDMLASL